MLKNENIALAAGAVIDADGCKSIRKMISVSRSTVHRLLRKDLKSKPFHPTVSQKFEAQLQTHQEKEIGLRKSSSLMNRMFIWITFRINKTIKNGKLRDQSSTLKSLFTL